MARRMKFVNILLSLLCLLTIPAISGCSSKVSTHGHSLEQAKLDKLVLGKTTRKDVLVLLGKPSFDGAFGSRKSYYNKQVMEEEVAGLSKTISRTLLVLIFDEKDVLKDFELKSIENDRAVTKLEAKTPTPGDTYTLTEQIFSNVRRTQ